MNFLKYFDIQHQQQTPKLYQFLLYTNRQKNNIYALDNIYSTELNMITNVLWLTYYCPNPFSPSNFKI